MSRLHGSATLPAGHRVRLRMPHRHDVQRLRALLERVGLDADELALRRALHFDPRRTLAVVATVLVGRSEEIVGVALMDRDSPDPDLLLADEAMAPGITALLEATVARSAVWPQKHSRASTR